MADTGQRRPARRPRRTRTATVVALVLALAATLGACGVTRGGDDPDNRRLRMMIPNSPGGGYDLTGRAAAQVMEEDDLTGRFEITNVIGASGTVAMQRLLNERGADDLVMLMGLGVVGATYTNDSAARVSKATPIARLVEEQEGLLVPADSPFETVDDLVTAALGIDASSTRADLKAAGSLLNAAADLLDSLLDALLGGGSGGSTDGSTTRAS